jgi:ribosomal protein S18 acetylase RimI-like enzyme
MMAANFPPTIRPLARSDLDAVVAIDAALGGRSRRAYFERRLSAAMREPRAHAQFAAQDASGVCGYILARVLEGEFGRTDPGLRLEVVGIRPDAQSRGAGRTLLAALCAWATKRGIGELSTQADWRAHAMVRWLDAMGFTLASNHVVDCAVEGGQYVASRDDAGSPAVEPGAGEIDYGREAGNDYDGLVRDRADVRSMQAGDIEAIVRVDRRITGHDRADYILNKFSEAMAESGIRVSLTARVAGAVVGYLMARADLGDFGRTEPVAVLDTIGVHPDYAHHGLGHALLSQLFANLGALRIERVETVVASRDLALLGFLYDVGFRPSQRLPFRRAV